MRNLPQELEEQSAILSKWMRNRKGVTAELWRYRLTHGIFGLILHDSDTKECLYVLCGGCHVLEAKTTWSNANLKISLANEQYRQFIVRDTENGLWIECHWVSFNTEKPWFFDYSDDTANRGGTRAEGQIEVEPSLFDETRHRHIDLDSRQCTFQEVDVFLQIQLRERGAMKAEFWSYRAHSQILDIRFQSLESALNFHIVCARCHSWKTKLWWPRSDVKVQLSLDENSRYLLQEEAAGWSIECDFILLTANVKPQFDPSWARRRKALREEQHKVSNPGE